MPLISPEILAEACGFSVAVCAAAFALGFLLWLFGWRGHRFWIVLISTVAAGVWGLRSGPAFGTHPIVAGLLVSVAAGALALALVRFVAFAAGGLAVWFLVRALVPTWDEPLVLFLIGGLVGLVLFRICTMALTSFAGTLLMAYAGLCLAHRVGKLEVVSLCEKHATALNLACGGIALAGLLAQFLLHRRREQMKRREDWGKRNSPTSFGGAPWWNRRQRSYRQAG